MRSDCPLLVRGGDCGHSSGIKKSKPAMEKRRRARINASLAELRSLIPDSVKRGNRRYSKMEKADILEMAVQYLRLLLAANKEKGYVSTASYSLGFNECTQEVNDFFRSSSPTTTRFKGSLLEHLNGCAPDNTPDSPSSSPKITVRTTLTPSSIIARCLLASTTISTPKKLTDIVRISTTPAAVSSTSDDIRFDDKPSLETEVKINIENITEPDNQEEELLIEEPQAQRTEAHNVKRDLINEFNIEHRDRGSNEVGWNKSNNSTLDVDRLTSNRNSSMNEGTAGVFKDQDMLNDIASKSKGISHTNSFVNLTERISDACSNANVFMHALVQADEESILCKEESTAASNLNEASFTETQTMVTVNTASQGSPTTSFTHEPNNSSKLDNNANNNKTLSNAKEKETYPSNASSSHSKQADENTTKTFILNVLNTSNDEVNSRKDKHIFQALVKSPQTLNDINPAKKEHVEQKCKEDTIEPKTLTKEKCDKTEDSSNILSKINMTAEKASINVSCLPSFLIPIFAQTSFPEKVATSQQTSSINSPNKTTISNSTEPANAQKAMVTRTTDSHLSKCIDSNNSISPSSLCKVVHSSNVNTCGSSLAQAKAAAIESDSYTPVHDLEERAKTHEDNNKKPHINLKMDSKFDEMLSLAMHFNLQTNIQEEDINTFENNKTANILDNDSISKNPSPTFTTNKDDDHSCPSHVHKKRVFSECSNNAQINFNPTSENQFHNISDSAKRMRLSQTNSAKITTPKEAAQRNLFNNQHFCTKFRPIAPKKDSMNGTATSDSPKEISLTQTYTVQSCKADFFKNSNSHKYPFFQNNNLEIEQTSFDDQLNFKVFREKPLSKTSSESNQVKMYDNAKVKNKSSANDDILTTVLKSRIPLDKMNFNAGRLNIDNQKHNVSCRDHEQRNNSKHLQQNRLCFTQFNNKESHEQITDKTPVNYLVEKQVTQILLNGKLRNKASHLARDTDEVATDLRCKQNGEYHNHRKAEAIGNFAKVYRGVSNAEPVSFDYRSLCREFPGFLNLASKNNESSEMKTEMWEESLSNIDKTAQPFNTGINSDETLELLSDKNKIMISNEKDVYRYVPNHAYKLNPGDKELNPRGNELTIQMWNHTPSRKMKNSPNNNATTTNGPEIDQLPSFANSFTSEPLNLSLRGPISQKTSRTQKTDTTNTESKPFSYLCVHDKINASPFFPTSEIHGEWVKDTDVKKTATSNNIFAHLNINQKSYHADTLHNGRSHCSCACSHKTTGDFSKTNGANNKDTIFGSSCLPEAIISDTMIKITDTPASLNRPSNIKNSECSSCIERQNVLITPLNSLQEEAFEEIFSHYKSGRSRENMTSQSPTLVSIKDTPSQADYIPQAREYELAFNYHNRKMPSRILSASQLIFNTRGDTEMPVEDVWRPW